MFVCVAGKNNIAVDVLSYLIENCNGRYDVGVVCNKNENGINEWQKSLRFFSHRFGVKEYQLSEIYEKEDVVFLSMEFDRIVKPELFKDARLYNIHFSLLPQYKGMYTSALPILNGEKHVGVTFHKIDQGIDTGDIIDQKKFELSKKDTSRDLYLKYIRYGTELVMKNLEDVLADQVVASPQSAENSTYYSKKCIDYSNLEIDLRQTAEGIERQIRAFSFREYQMPVVHDRKIIASRITDMKSQGRPGKILSEDSHGMMLSTIDYNIYLYFDRFDELIKACAEGDIRQVEEIAVAEEHINAADSKGWTPLIVAVYHNNIDIVKFLLSHGADVHVKNNNGTNLLMYAKDAYLNTGDKTVFRELMSMGLRVDECDYAGHNLEFYVNRNGRSLEELMNYK